MILIKTPVVSVLGFVCYAHQSVDTLTLTHTHTLLTQRQIDRQTDWQTDSHTTTAAARTAETTTILMTETSPPPPLLLLT